MVIELTRWLQYDAVSVSAMSEREEFSRFIEKHAQFSFSIAHAVLHDAASSEDVVQEVFFKLYRNAAWTRMVDERAFLARMVWREAVDRRPRQAEISLTREHQHLMSHSHSPEQAVLRADLCGLLHEGVRQLPTKLRQVLILSAFEELTSREIGLILSVPEGTVRTRLKRARNELKKLLMAKERTE